MASSIFNSMGILSNNNNNNLSNFFSHINDFNNFRSNFKGNPQQQAEMLLKSGRMTQEQFQQYAQLANLIRPLIGR